MLSILLANFDYATIDKTLFYEIKGFLIGAFMIDKLDNMVNWLQRSLMSKVLFSAGVAIIILHHVGVFYLPVLIYQTVFLLVIIPLVLFLIGVTILWINAFIKDE